MMFCCEMVLLFLSALSALAAATGGRSAASEAQIRFAIENKYDDTGPGAKSPDYAYKTFSKLEDALLGYLNDPDTKLPESERRTAYRKLVHKYPAIKQQKPPISVTRYTFPDKKVFYHQPESQLGILDLRSLVDLPKKKQILDTARLKKLDISKPKPLSLATYSREAEDAAEKFDPNPQYTYSYGVHDRQTGDSKRAQETRDGGTVTGYYTVADADGRQRTVHYTADDRRGFRAVVRHAPIHGPPANQDADGRQVQLQHAR